MVWWINSVAADCRWSVELHRAGAKYYVSTAEAWLITTVAEKAALRPVSAWL